MALIGLLIWSGAASAAIAPDPDLNDDGVVNILDYSLVASCFGHPVSDPGCAVADTNGDGQINFTDLSFIILAFGQTFPVGPTVSIAVDSSPMEIFMSVGETVNIATTVNFTTDGADPFSIGVIQALPGGIGVSPGVASGFTKSSSFSTVDNQAITALAPGVYVIETTATISQTGDSSTKTVVVNVSDGEDGLALNAPGSDPASLLPDSFFDVFFSVVVEGVVPSGPVFLNENTGSGLSGVLNDQGEDGDLLPDDGVFSGTVQVDTTGMLVDHCLKFQASTGGDSSPELDLCISNIPDSILASDLSLSNVVSDPATGGEFVANEIGIQFVAGISESQKMTVVGNVGGAVVGGIPNVGLVQVLFSPTPSLSGLLGILSTLNALPEVEEASLNTIVPVPLSVTPSDPRFSTQSGIKKIRSDEAWTIARGAVTIAVVDTGVDYNHPDLLGKVIKGKDFANGDNDPMDDHGHGTHVAGIAAANTDNGVGVSGVSWNSKILAVKVLKASGGGTSLAVAQGIVYAANKGARVINLSVGGAGGQFIKCLAVSYARFIKGSLVVAAAGNNGNSTRFYPAACPGAIAVGNTTLADGRNGSSNFGSWVDLAAPGTSIMSTLPSSSCTLCSPSGYGRLTGTSMASPMVAGAAAVVLSRTPGLSSSQVEQRLERTAKMLPAGLQLGAGRIDLMEAVFNGSFEEGNLALWTKVGTASSLSALGPITPRHRKRMGYVSTGPAGAQVSGSLSQSFLVQPGVTSFPLSFCYTFVSEEYPEFVGTQFNDKLTITLQPPFGPLVTLASESINGAAFSAIGGINFPGGDTTVGWTGWKPVSVTVPAVFGVGTYKIFVSDAGDSVFDTVTLIDQIRFKVGPAC